jgi:hypothetical protein
MSGWAIFGIVVAVIVVLLLLMNAKDLYRYVKIRNM